MYCNFHTVIFRWVVLIIWACFLRALMGGDFFFLLQVSKDSKLRIVLNVCMEIKLFKIIIKYNDHLCWFKWKLANRYTCQTGISHICILNLILIFLYLAVITIQYIKQYMYQIPDLLTEFSACNKPFWLRWSGPGIWTVWRSQCGRPSLDWSSGGPQSCPPLCWSAPK